MVTHAELLAAAALAILAIGAESLHSRRCRRLAPLAFGPKGRPAPWALFAPALRVTALTALAWGLVTFLEQSPKAHVAAAIPDKERRHVLIVLDVSPSMRLRDAGPNAEESRMKRTSIVMDSFLDRIPVELYLVSIVACYNGAKPVVVDTKDLEVVRNIFGDLPMHQAFPSGKTDLFSGLAAAAKIAHPWRPRSTLLLVLSDGDTVPAIGMPKMPAAIADVLIVGVGDPRQGSFIDGRMSHQDASTLRQIAARLGGTYHDGNTKHISTQLLNQLTVIPRQGAFEQLTRREYALLACGLGASILAFLPVLLHHFGTAWRPGVRRPALTAKKGGHAQHATSAAVVVRE